MTRGRVDWTCSCLASRKQGEVCDYFLLSFRCAARAQIKMHVIPSQPHSHISITDTCVLTDDARMRELGLLAPCKQKTNRVCMCDYTFCLMLGALRELLMQMHVIPSQVRSHADAMDAFVLTDDSRMRGFDSLAPSKQKTRCMCDYFLLY